jgi:HAD superfamily hydrolase (TIGR01484 family)
MLGRYQKVLLVDYDGVLAQQYRLVEDTVVRLKELLAQGFKIALITGRTAPTLGEFIAALERHGIGKKISIFCEHGCVEYVREKGLWIPHVREDLEEYKKSEYGIVARRLRRIASQHGFKEVFIQNITTFYFSGRSAEDLGIPFEKVVKAVEEEVNKINEEMWTKLRIIKTRAGLEIVPAKINKGVAARSFLGRIRKPYVGFAFGDIFLDRKMATGSKIKFIPVKSPQEFLKATENLSEIIKRRMKRLARLRKERRAKRKAKGGARDIIKRIVRRK